MKWQTFFTTRLAKNSGALVSGALMTFAFAPLQLYPLAVLLPAILLALWFGQTPRQAFWYGWLFGLGMFSTSIYWVFISIYVYGAAPLLLAAFFTALLIAYMALFPALTGYCLNRFFPNKNSVRLICAFPALWVFFEWARSLIFTGFPWLLLGYSQINSPLRGYAAVFSVYGVSLAVLMSSGLLIKIILHLRQKNLIPSGLSLVAGLVLWGLGSGLAHILWTTPFGPPVQVSLVQGNIPQQLKWSPETIQPTLAEYSKLTEPHWSSNIIVWPESAIPISLQEAEPFLNDINKKAILHHTTFITGIPVLRPNDGGYYNAVIALGDGSGYYLKHRLVPFGEYVPLRNLFHTLLDVLHIPMSDFIAARGPIQLLEAGKLKFAAFICYEIAYPELVLYRGAELNLLLTVSNDAWFGHSIAQAQHLEIAQMRALEMNRPLLFVSNNGITATITPFGKIQAAAPPFQATVLTTKVQPMQGKTPWQRTHMDPLLIILTGLIFLAFRKRRSTDLH